MQAPVYDGLDVIKMNKGKRRFVWDDDGLPDGCDFKLRRTNTVTMAHICDRGSGLPMRLSPDGVDYSRFVESADPKFRSQRSVWHWITNTTSFVYFTGKVLSVGGDIALVSFAGLYMTASALKNSMLDGDRQFLIGGIRIVNGVLTGDMMRPVDMPVLARVEMDDMAVRYEPDLFSGAVLTPTAGGGTITVYHTGKFIVAGASTNERVRRALTRLYQLTQTEPILLDASCEDDVCANARNTRRRNIKGVDGACGRRTGGPDGRDAARKMAAGRQIVRDGLRDAV